MSTPHEAQRAISSMNGALLDGAPSASTSGRARARGGWWLVAAERGGGGGGGGRGFDGPVVAAVEARRDRRNRC